MEHGIPHCRRKSTLDTQTSQAELSLAETRCINSMPAIVVAAVAKPLKPSIVAICCLTPRWSCSIRLFKYFDDRSFVSAGQQAIGFQLTHRAVRRGIAVQGDRPGSIVLAFDRLPKKRLAAATSRLALSLKSTVRPARSTAR